MMKTKKLLIGIAITIAVVAVSFTIYAVVKMESDNATLEQMCNWPKPSDNNLPKEKAKVSIEKRFAGMSSLFKARAEIGYEHPGWTEFTGKVKEETAYFVIFAWIATILMVVSSFSKKQKIINIVGFLAGIFFICSIVFSYFRYEPSLLFVINGCLTIIATVYSFSTVEEKQKEKRTKHYIIIYSCSALFFVSIYSPIWKYAHIPPEVALALVFILFAIVKGWAKDADT